MQSSKNKLEKECEKAKRYKELKAKLLQIMELEKVIIFDKQVKHVESIEKKVPDKKPIGVTMKLYTLLWDSQVSQIKPTINPTEENINVIIIKL